jgi:hypothetical protein
MDDSTTSRWAKWAGGGVLLAIALGAGITGLTLNVSHGLKTSLAQGVIYGLGDIGKIVVPVVAGIIGWNRQMRGVVLICVVASIWCAVNYYADANGAALLAGQNQAALLGQTERNIAELEAEVRAARALANIEAKRKKCGPECRRLQERADRLAADLESARGKREGQGPAKTSGLALLAGTTFGVSTDVAAQWKDVIGAALFLVLIESLVWLSVPAMVLLAHARCRETALQPQPEAVAIAALDRCNTVANSSSETDFAITTPVAPATGATARRGSRQYWLERLQRERPEVATQVERGAMSVYAGCIAAGLRKAPAKRKWSADDFLSKAKA